MINIELYGIRFCMFRLLQKSYLSSIKYLEFYIYRKYIVIVSKNLISWAFNFLNINCKENGKENSLELLENIIKIGSYL